MKTKALIFMLFAIFPAMEPVYGQKEAVQQTNNLEFQKKQWLHMEEVWNNNEKIKLSVFSTSDDNKYYSDAQYVYILSKFKHGKDKNIFHIFKDKGEPKKVCQVDNCSGFGYIVIVNDEIIDKIYQGSNYFYLIINKKTGKYKMVEKPGKT